MKINTMDATCMACGKQIVGIELPTGDRWFHADGLEYRHHIIPDDEDYHQRSDWYEMREDRDRWMEECLKAQTELRLLKEGKTNV